MYYINKERKPPTMSKINAELKKLTTEYYSTFNNYCERSHEQRLKELKPGEYVPPKGKLSEYYRDEMEAKANEIKYKVNALIDPEIKAVKKKVNAAPSAEAVAAVSMLKMRNPKALTSDILTTLIEEYGDNPLTYDTIRDIAKDSKVSTPYNYKEHPLRKQLDNIEAASRSLNKAFNVFDTENGHNTPGFKQILDTYIDEAFEPDPIINY